MSNLQHRQSKIQEKRKQTQFRDFVMEIASWCPVNFYKDDKFISRYPITPRKGELISAESFNENRQGGIVGIELTNNGFFNDLQSLRNGIAKPRRRVFGESENSEYADTIGFGAKNFYLTICGGLDCSNVLYGFYIVGHCHNIIDSINITNGCNNIYSSTLISQSYNVFYSRCIFNCSNIWFSTNLQGCEECILCDNLNNQKYCINNQQLTKEIYLIEKDKLLKSKYQYKGLFEHINRISTNIGSNSSTGYGVMYSENIENGIFVTQVNNGRNLIAVGNGDKIEDSYDCLTSATQAEHGYANMGVSPGSFMYCSMNSGEVDHIFYCVYCDNCNHCLGCYGLKNKSYCILNKQYTKEERYEKVDEIFAQMEADETLGQFFPATMNPFYFNDTAAYLIDPSFTKEEVTAKGYLWRDEPIKVDIPEGAEVVKIQELDKFEGFDEQGNWNINKNILKKIIQDEQGNVYRIVPMEYDFLMKYGLPLPRKHWLDRMKENFRIT